MFGGLDPETRGLIKLGMQQKRMVEAGRMRIEDATALPEGTRLEKGVVILPGAPMIAAIAAVPLFIGTLGTIVTVSTLLILAIALSISAVRLILIYQIYDVPVYMGIFIGILILALGAVVFWAREIRQWRLIAALQVSVAILAGIITYFGTPDPVAKLIVLIAAAITIADGLSILRRAAK